MVTGNVNAEFGIDVDLPGRHERQHGSDISRSIGQSVGGRSC